jgi:NADPH2:quinone reductase
MEFSLLREFQIAFLQRSMSGNFLDQIFVVAKQWLLSFLAGAPPWVIALASSDEKRELATRLGADATADSWAEDLREAILDANGGEKVDVVLHMSGTGFEAELHSLGMLGRMVLFGNAARHPNELAMNYLLQTSKSVLGFWLIALIAQRRDLIQSMTADLLGAVASGELEVVIGNTYPLGEAARAHTDLQERRSIGKLLLDPSA